MPKALALFISVVAVAMALSDCGGNSSSTPAASPSASFSPNPTITGATINVTINQKPAVNIPVEESTPASQSSPRPGTPFATIKTGKEGNAKFSKLNPNLTYCWVAVINTKVNSSTCVNWTVWQYDIIQLGT